tara:strand:+ start:368 stop:4549 length:4182 start_codon:yes stop_codon:yes gene_type:complete
MLVRDDLREAAELSHELELMEMLQEMKLEMEVLELVQRPIAVASPDMEAASPAQAKRSLFGEIQGGAFGTAARRLDYSDSQNAGSRAANEPTSVAIPHRPTRDAPAFSFAGPGSGPKLRRPAPAAKQRRGGPPSGVADDAALALLAATSAVPVSDAEEEEEDCSACADDCCSDCDCLCHADEDDCDECSACADDCCSDCDCLCHASAAETEIETEMETATATAAARDSESDVDATLDAEPTTTTTTTTRPPTAAAAVRPPPPPGMGRVRVMLPSEPPKLRAEHGNAVRFLMPLSSKRADLSSQLFAKIGVQPHEQRLFWRGIELDGRTRLRWPSATAPLQLWLEMSPGLRGAVAMTQASTAKGPRWGGPVSKHHGVQWDSRRMRWAATMEISSAVVGALKGEETAAAPRSAATTVADGRAARAMSVARVVSSRLNDTAAAAAAAATVVASLVRCFAGKAKPRRRRRAPRPPRPQQVVAPPEQALLGYFSDEDEAADVVSAAHERLVEELRKTGANQTAARVAARARLPLAPVPPFAIKATTLARPRGGGAWLGPGFFTDVAPPPKQQRRGSLPAPRSIVATTVFRATTGCAIELRCAAVRGAVQYVWRLAVSDEGSDADEALAADDDDDDAENEMHSDSSEEEGSPPNIRRVVRKVKRKEEKQRPRPQWSATTKEPFCVAQCSTGRLRFKVHALAADGSAGYVSNASKAVVFTAQSRPAGRENSMSGGGGARDFAMLSRHERVPGARISGPVDALLSKQQVRRKAALHRARRVSEEVATSSSPTRTSHRAGTKKGSIRPPSPRSRGIAATRAKVPSASFGACSKAKTKSKKPTRLAWLKASRERERAAAINAANDAAATAAAAEAQKRSTFGRSQRWDHRKDAKRRGTSGAAKRGEDGAAANDDDDDDASWAVLKPRLKGTLSWGSGPRAVVVKRGNDDLLLSPTAEVESGIEARLARVRRTAARRKAAKAQVGGPSVGSYDVARSLRATEINTHGAPVIRRKAAKSTQQLRAQRIQRARRSAREDGAAANKDELPQSGLDPAAPRAARGVLSFGKPPRKPSARERARMEAANSPAPGAYSPHDPLRSAISKLDAGAPRMVAHTSRSKLAHWRKSKAESSGGPGPGEYELEDERSIAIRAARGHGTVRIGRTTGRAQATGPFGERSDAAREEEATGGIEGDVLVIEPNDPAVRRQTALPWSKIPRFRGGDEGDGDDDDDAHLRVSADSGDDNGGRAFGAAAAAAASKRGGVSFAQQLGRPPMAKRDPTEGDVLLLRPDPTVLEPPVRGGAAFGDMQAARFEDAEDAAVRVGAAGSVLQLELGDRTFSDAAVRGGTFGRTGRDGAVRKEVAVAVPEFGSTAAGGGAPLERAKTRKRRPHRYAPREQAFDDDDEF